jgi:hypothetical protein
LVGFSVFALDYDINVSLNVNTKTIKGSEVIEWTNNFNTATDIIPLHLYMNAFSDTKTVFMAESGGRHRSSKLDLNKGASYGYCKITDVLVNNDKNAGEFYYLREFKEAKQYNLYDSSEISAFVKPDNTIGVVKLNSKVMPGESVTLEIKFETKLPRIFARTGYYKNYFFAGQWFPKIAVFEGEKGWNCHLFHLNSEFFADFGNFKVSVTIPENYIIGATGVKKSENKDNGVKKAVFVAENVHDFAFTTWDKYKVAKDKWKNVDITLLYPPGNEGTVKRQLTALKGAMDSYSYLCGYDYPYPAFTLVDVPMQAGGAGGMEYPMLVTGASMSPYVPSGIRMNEMVIIHEFGHNYFYGMLASNEFENAWMDEGLNSFATSFAVKRQYGYIVDMPFIKIDPFELDALGNARYDGVDFPAKPSWAFMSNGSYSTNSYSKVSIHLKTLENILGEDKFLAIFREYFDRYKFTHPNPEDFLGVVREIGGEEAFNFVYKTLYTTDKIDFAVYKLTSTKKKPKKGYDNFTLLDNKMETAGEKEDNADGKIIYENTIIVENKGDFCFPVSVKVVFEDGNEKVFNLNELKGFKKIEFESDSKAILAVIDYENIYQCDVNLSNNAYVLKPNRKPFIKLSLFFATIMEVVTSRLLLML